MRRHDIDSKIDSLKDMMNQTVPTQLQSVDPMEKAMAYDTMAEYYEAIGGSDDLIEKQKQMAAYLRNQAQQMLLQQQMMAAAGPAPIPGPGSGAPPAPPAAAGGA